MLDILIAFLGLIFTLPIVCFALLLTALESGFPMFFSQNRTGFLGQPYILFKIRTMRVNAEEKNAKWAEENDNRVTRIGSFLRKWRIDEIPQFWNVIKGEMSIVGPRPERPEFQDRLINKVPHWNCRHLVKPGLTGWAQIKFRYASDMESSEEKLAYDLYYIKHASILMDIQIILSTLRSLAKGSR
jgi:lipopolysaccharide/colanic/teichoic acid biosynthesis glycosyltransferase